MKIHPAANGPMGPPDYPKQNLAKLFRLMEGATAPCVRWAIKRPRKAHVNIRKELAAMHSMVHTHHLVQG